VKELAASRSPGIAVFAYGSNLCVERMRARVRSARVLTVANLAGHALRFHKRGRDGSAKADAWLSGDPHDAVWGVVYELAMADKAALDRIEGVDAGYLDREVRLVTMSGDAVVARLYKAQPSHVDPTLAPFTWYRDFVLHGAVHHRLPADYLAGIREVEAVEDPDRERHGREAAVLSTAAVAEESRD
jgi:gamma-glutamylcyclotransferase